MRFKALLFAAVTAMSIAPSMAAGYGEFTGDWRNEDAGTSSITRVRIQPTGGGLKVRVWGQCSPSDCDWGTEQAVAYSPSPSGNPATDATDLTVTFHPGFAETILHLRDRPGDSLQYTIFTRFTDGSGRRPYTSRGALRKHLGGWPGWGGWGGPGGPGGGGWPPGGPGGGPGGPGGGGGSGITLYEHTGYGGGSLFLNSDTPNLVPMGWNDITSSIRVSPGEVWQVCKDAFYGGPCRTISSDTPSLVPFFFNDVVSSARRISGGGGPGGPGGGPGGPGGPGGGPGAGLSFSEDCISFDWHNVDAQYVGGEWKVVEGSHWMLSFGSRAAEAQQAANTIRSYRFSATCYIGRPNPGMVYWKRGNNIPTTGMPGDDCIGNNPDTTQARWTGGSWKIVDGGHSMLNFGGNEAQARQAEEVIRYYRLSQQCFVGRPNPGMTYWLAE